MEMKKFHNKINRMCIKFRELIFCAFDWQGNFMGY